MGKIAFVFSGQGAQYTGMGKALCASDEAAAEVFAKADAIRPGTSHQCFEGTSEELKATDNTQPCMMAVELAAAAAAVKAGIKADMTAGFSLGEIAALTFSGAVSFEDGFSLVCRRGELMQKSAEKAETGMYAVVRLTDEQVESVCSEFANVYPVNYNCPGQVAVAGLKSELADFSKKIKEAGGRAIPLKVAGAFHSPFMQEAAEGFAAELAKVNIGEPKLPLYSDYTGKVYDGDPKVLLSEQIKNPVRWSTIIRNMIAEGVDTFIEMGPGTTLCGLISKTDPNVRTFNIESPDTLAKVIAEVL